MHGSFTVPGRPPTATPQSVWRGWSRDEEPSPTCQGPVMLRILKGKTWPRSRALLEGTRLSVQTERETEDEGTTTPSEKEKESDMMQGEGEGRKRGKGVVAMDITGLTSVWRPTDYSGRWLEALQSAVALAIRQSDSEPKTIHGGSLPLSSAKKGVKGKKTGSNAQGTPRRLSEDKANSQKRHTDEGTPSVTAVQPKDRPRGGKPKPQTHPPAQRRRRSSASSAASRSSHVPAAPAAVGPQSSEFRSTAVTRREGGNPVGTAGGASAYPPSIPPESEGGDLSVISRTPTQCISPILQADVHAAGRGERTSPDFLSLDRERSKETHEGTEKEEAEGKEEEKEKEGEEEDYEEVLQEVELLFSGGLGLLVSGAPSSSSQESGAASHPSVASFEACDSSAKLAFCAPHVHSTSAKASSPTDIRAGHQRERGSGVADREALTAFANSVVASRSLVMEADSDPSHPLRRRERALFRLGAAKSGGPVEKMSIDQPLEASFYEDKSSAKPRRAEWPDMEKQKPKKSHQTPTSPNPPNLPRCNATQPSTNATKKEAAEQIEADPPPIRTAPVGSSMRQPEVLQFTPPQTARLFDAPPISIGQPSPSGLTPRTFLFHAGSPISPSTHSSIPPVLMNPAGHLATASAMTLQPCVQAPPPLQPHLQQAADGRIVHFQQPQQQFQFQHHPLLQPHAGPAPHPAYRRPSHSVPEPNWALTSNALPPPHYQKPSGPTVASKTPPTPGTLLGGQSPPPTPRIQTSTVGEENTSTVKMSIHRTHPEASTSMYQPHANSHFQATQISPTPTPHNAPVQPHATLQSQWPVSHPPFAQQHVSVPFGNVPLPGLQQRAMQNPLVQQQQQNQYPMQNMQQTLVQQQQQNQYPMQNMQQTQAHLQQYQPTQLHPIRRQSGLNMSLLASPHGVFSSVNSPRFQPHQPAPFLPLTGPSHSIPQQQRLIHHQPHETLPSPNTNGAPPLYPPNNNQTIRRSTVERLSPSPIPPKKPPQTRPQNQPSEHTFAPQEICSPMTKAPTTTVGIQVSPSLTAPMFTVAASPLAPLPAPVSPLDSAPPSEHSSPSPHGGSPPHAGVQKAPKVGNPAIPPPADQFEGSRLGPANRQTRGAPPVVFKRGWDGGYIWCLPSMGGHEFRVCGS
uniref:Uncharacterized protein n=1 Tax=Chromera velia CCMP2878 TaxID=1169474 RepID=A0A0G4I802_9ALVE|eukprot:Cvel_11735.t1-p1 / transcript=Cvel_11735.t1 / gene=Cvel_11735 / organism=Chromera_velia_CCMP2878 / gene_product=hypothetical protein / transcript_product=hypothetical protein / location=Cvel_scaffold745:46989-53796(-) / protein_length=1136 / sequence_SO=supercontig / SO=protein_coding / is_pseudo=false